MAEIYLGTQQNIYFGGNLVKSASAIAYSIAISVSDRMGLNYTEDQEQAANATAQAILGYLSVPPDAYSSALNKIAGYLHSSGNYYSLMGSLAHPPVYSQSSDTIGSSEIKFYNDNYNLTISFVTTFNAALEYGSKNYIACEKLVDQNIKAGIAVEEDYILKAMAMRILYSSVEKNLEAIDYLNTAKGLDIVPSNAVYKQARITYLGLGQKAKAIESFNQYLEAISREIESIKAYYIDYINDSKYNYWADEMNWTRKMIYKLSYR